MALHARRHVGKPPAGRESGRCPFARDDTDRIVKIAQRDRRHVPIRPTTNTKRRGQYQPSGAVYRGRQKQAPQQGGYMPTGDAGRPKSRLWGK